MEPDRLAVDAVSPPIPPPLPPPVAPPRTSQLGASVLWRWNDRLALVVGGLTILLIGTVAGRVLGPPSSGIAVNDQPAVVASAASIAGPAPIADSEAEVNPPEPAAVEPVAAADTPSEPVVEKPAEQPPAPIASSPPPLEAVSATPVIAADPQTEIPASEEASAESVVSQLPQVLLTTPISVEGKVASIIPPPVTQVCEPATKFNDRKLNTALTWSESANEAAEKAEEEEKLVFLIHVSGNFELPGFT